MQRPPERHGQQEQVAVRAGGRTLQLTSSLDKDDEQAGEVSTERDESQEFETVLC